MASLWMFCVIVLLCYNTQLQTVLAGEILVSKQIDDWIDYAGVEVARKVLEKWYGRGSGKLITTVGPGGESWFVTPLLNLSNTSYLDIEASCNYGPCQLQIYGTNRHSLALSLNNFEFIQNVTLGTRSMKTATITKYFPHLCILARTSTTAPGTIAFYIYSIRIRYYVCENTTMYNTDVSQIYSSTTNISQLVQCPDNALTIDGKSTNITVQCTPKGNWTFGDQRCVCDKGFFLSNHSCTRCPTDHYKTTTGDESCKKCSDHGRTTDTMHTLCQCKEDHYIGDDEDGPCYALPSEVYDLRIQNMISNSVYLSWKKPVSGGGFGSIHYTVECYHCTSESRCDMSVGNAMFVPAKTNLHTTSVAVFGLNFNEKYKFKVVSMNSLRNVPGSKWKFVEKMTVVGKATQAANTETKCKCEEKASNSMVMFFAGAGAALVIVLSIVIVILMHKRRMRTSKKSTNVHDVRTVKMQVQSLAETQATQSQTNQAYVSSIDDETTHYEEPSSPSVYDKLSRNQEDATAVDNTYQKLSKLREPVHAW